MASNWNQLFANCYPNMLINNNLVILIFLCSFQFTYQQGSKCGQYEFQCVISKKCIPIELRCDGTFIDCNIHEPIKIIDLSDELDCPCNALSQFTCHDGSCIALTKKCDRFPDCSDISDELYCETCQSNEFQCVVDRICIPREKKCNGIANCQDASDEINCPDLFLNENNEDDVQHSKISTRSLVYDTNNHLDEPSEKENTNLSTYDQIGTEKYDEFYTPVLPIGQTKKTNEANEDDPNLQSISDENQQTGMNEPEDEKTCSSNSEDQNNEMRVFFGSMYAAAVKLTKKRQRRLKKVLFDFILEMEEEQEKDSFNEKKLEKRLPVADAPMHSPLLPRDPKNVSLYPAVDSITKLENGTFFPASGGYLMSHDYFRVGKDFELNLEIKPKNRDGILTIVHSGKDFFILQMINGSVKFTVDNGNGPFYTSFEPQEANYLCNNGWHSIKALKAKMLAILIVDGQGTNFGSDPKGAKFTDTDHPLYVGGYPPELSSAKGIEINVQYVGCMKNLKINGKNYDLSSFNASGLVLHECPIF